MLYHDLRHPDEYLPDLPRCAQLWRLHLEDDDKIIAAGERWDGQPCYLNIEGLDLSGPYSHQTTNEHGPIPEANRDELGRVLRLLQSNGKPRVSIYGPHPLLDGRYEWQNRELRESQYRMLYDKLPSGRFGDEGVIDLLPVISFTAYWQPWKFDVWEHCRRIIETARFFREFGKPLRAFASPVIYKKNDDRLMDFDQWRRVLDTCVLACDEVVLFGADTDPPTTENQRMIDYAVDVAQEVT